jgi:hypothetical protein
MTASRLPACFENVHPFYESIADLWAEMQGHSVKGENASMRAGNLLENIFPAAVAEVHPEWQIVKATTFHLLADLRLGATPDFWIGDDGLPRRKPSMSWIGARRRPQLYWISKLDRTHRHRASRGRVSPLVATLSLFNVRATRGRSQILAAVPFAPRGRRRVADRRPEDEIEALLDDGSHKDLSKDNYCPRRLSCGNPARDPQRSGEGA